MWQGFCRAQRVDALQRRTICNHNHSLKGDMHSPVSRVPIFLYSSLSFVVMAFSFSSSPRSLRNDISLSNFIFHSLNDFFVTGVPRVRASSS
jgi:hypothetical protein